GETGRSDDIAVHLQIQLAQRIGGRRVRRAQRLPRLLVIDAVLRREKAASAFGGRVRARRGHAGMALRRGASRRRRDTSATMRCAARSTLSAVVSAPSDKRTLAAASAGLRPMARSTWEDSARAALQVAPDDTANGGCPSFSPVSSAAPCTPGTLTLRICAAPSA